MISAGPPLNSNLWFPPVPVRAPCVRQASASRGLWLLSAQFGTPTLVALAARGRNKMGGARGGGNNSGFRNPHNLPVKDCVVCGRPFTWRKKWERCWDEVLTCSNRCKTERRGRGRQGGEAGGAAGTGVAACDSQDSSDDGEDGQPRAGQALADHGGSDGETAALLDLVKPDVQGSDAEEAQEDAEEDPRSANRARKKALKAAKRERKRSPAAAAAAKQKPCDICQRQVDLLIRCTVDQSQEWKMLCGRCWKDASGGIPDGDEDHPHYRYGGLWKNRSAQVTMPKFGKKKIDA